MTRVRPVGSRADLRAFLELPYRLHRGDPHWVPPLRFSERDRLSPGKNPFFEHASHQYFLAERDNRVVGRVAAFDDALHNQVHRDNLGSFGFFEAEDAESARGLLTAAEHWARARGRSCLRGPLNPSMNEQAGLLIDGFDTEPMVMMPHNPPEYAAHLESAGYAKVKDLYAWLYDLRHPPPERIAQLADRVCRRYGLIVRPIELKEFALATDRLRELYCSAWESNWGFVPPALKEFRHTADSLRWVFDPRCAVLAELDGKPVGCAIAILDLNQALQGTGGRLFPLGLYRLLSLRKHVSRARLLLLGVLAEYRHCHLYPALLHQLHRQAQGGPIQQCEFSLVLEDNRDVNQPAEAAGLLRYKTYRIYQKHLG